MRRRLAILAAIALGFASVVLCQVPSGGQEKPAPVPQEKKQDAKTPGYQWSELWAPANIPNWILCLVGGWAGLMALRTLKEIRVQAKYMERQTKILEDSVAVAKDSVKAATDQIAMTQEKERARFHIMPAEFQAVERNQPAQLGMYFVNIGSTSAFDVRVEAGGRIAVDGLETEQGEYTDLAVATLVKPEGREESWVVCDFPEQWERQVVNGRLVVTFDLIGRIKYRDIFDAVHIEDFAFRMNVHGIETMPRNLIGLKIMREWHPFLPKPTEWEF